MAFSTQRGRPRAQPRETHDHGTPELRLKHALRLTAEPIDLCLERGLITREHHRCGLHLRWLHSVRYGAPVLTTRYADRCIEPAVITEEDTLWRSHREQEYHAAIAELARIRRRELVMRICVFNELPAFLNPRLQKRAWHQTGLADELARLHQQFQHGLEALHRHWRASAYPEKASEF